jgi:hypothetical protein
VVGLMDISNTNRDILSMNIDQLHDYRNDLRKQIALSAASLLKTKIQKEIDELTIATNSLKSKLKAVEQLINRTQGIELIVGKDLGNVVDTTDLRVQGKGDNFILTIRGVAKIIVGKKMFLEALKSVE